MKDKKEDKKQEEAIESEVLDDVTFVESTEDGEALPQKDIAKKLREDLKTCRKEKEEYLTGWQRSKADYINLQKELEEVRVNSSVFAKENMLINLLPALDSFEMAFGNKDAWEKVNKEWRTGIEYIYQQLIESLKNSGIEKVDITEVDFDPKIHQSIKTIETDKKEKDHTVAEIVQAGYKIGDRVVRPASVNIFEYKK